MIIGLQQEAKKDYETALNLKKNDLEDEEIFKLGILLFLVSSNQILDWKVIQKINFS